MKTSIYRRNEISPEGSFEYAINHNNNAQAARRYDLDYSQVNGHVL